MNLPQSESRISRGSLAAAPTPACDRYVAGPAICADQEMSARYI